MLAAYNIRRSSVVLNPRGRVLRGLGALGDDGGGGGGGDGTGDSGSGDSGSSSVDSGSGDSGSGVVDTGLDLGGDSGVTVGTLATVDVVAQAESSTEAALDAITQADMDEGAAMTAAANASASAAAQTMVAAQLDAAAAKAGFVNGFLSMVGKLGISKAAAALGLPGVVVTAGMFVAGQMSASVNSGKSGDAAASKAAIDSAVDTAVGVADFVNANPNLPQAVKTTVMTVQNNVATVNTVLQANNFDLRSPAYKRFLPENGGAGIPALYKEIRDFISTHNKAEIDQAMQASGVSNADVIAAFQAAGTSQPGSGSNLA
ncbi:MAG: hypothetical protein EBZ75_15270, partial [Oxalobacteraceae bacterium]|nr:hypothetical protein [Oxalobacteraceae bacterium]